MTPFIHRLRMTGISRCGAREFEPGKVRVKMSSTNRKVNCPECLAFAKGKRLKAKAEFATIGGGR